MERKFCVFCGENPNKKNKEHVLPQWLLAMTGDPKRVVTFGQNYKTGKLVRFDWSSFVVPSCTSCNSSYSLLENNAKVVVERLLRREALTSQQYMLLMDWLDKIRIAVWLAYHQLQGNPTDILPSFSVDTRSAIKDRMIAIYSVTGQPLGLNAIGAESLIFHRQPSCFGLRINDLFITNMSADYLFSARCGFPFPKSQELVIGGNDHGKLALSGFKTARRVKHPLLRCSIIEPSVHLYQPMMAQDVTGSFQSGFIGSENVFDSYIFEHTVPPHPSGKGILFRQTPSKVVPLYNQSSPVEFVEVEGHHAWTMGDLVNQVYKMQKWIFEQTIYKSTDLDAEKAYRRFHKKLLKSHSLLIKGISR